MIVPTTSTYIANQLALFAGGLDHVMVEMTGHLHAGDDRLEFNIVLTHCPTNQPIAMQVPVIRGRITHLEALAADIAELIGHVRQLIDPFP